MGYQLFGALIQKPQPWGGICTLTPSHVTPFHDWEAVFSVPGTFVGRGSKGRRFWFW